MIESMERIDVLKGIEQILVQKAYEVGHISHRADGDWQKQADGSWKPYKGQSAPQTQETAPTENTEYGEITEEDLIETPEVDQKTEIDKINKDVTSFLDRVNAGEFDSIIKKYQDAMSELDEDEDEDEIGEMQTDLIYDCLEKAGLDYLGDWEDEEDGDISDVKEDAFYNTIFDAVVDREPTNDGVQKSAVRDMQSTPTTKNVGF